MGRDIQQAIQEHKERVLQMYPEEQVLGIFLYGSQNYGTATENSDVDTKAIIIPTFEQLCLKPAVSKELHLDNGEHCEVKDIREMANMFKKQNVNFLEILFTDYCWVNPRYKTIWEGAFIHNREDICHYDENKAIQSICGQAIHTLKQDAYSGKKLSNGYRLYYFLQHYLKKEPYQDCIFLKDEQEMYFIKYLKSHDKFIDYEYDKLLEGFQDLKQVVRHQDARYKEEVEKRINAGVMGAIYLNIPK